MVATISTSFTTVYDISKIILKHFLLNVIKIHLFYMYDSTDPMAMISKFKLDIFYSKIK